MYFFVFLLPFILLAIIIWVSYFISAKMYLSLQKNNSKYAQAKRVLFFILIFALLSFLGGYLIVANVRLGR